jgi:outer membrane protein TolC
VSGLEQQIALDVSDAVRVLETNSRRIDAYKLARELAEKTSRPRSEAGRACRRTILSSISGKLANARSLELKARIDYILSIERLEKAMGVSLDKWKLE